MDLSKLHQVLHWINDGKIKELEDVFNQSAQLKTIGVSIDISDLKHPAVVIKKVEDIHRGGIGGDAVNGGIISMLIDLAIGLLGLPYYGEGLTATHHLSIHFIKPLNALAVRLEAEETHVINNRVFGHVKVMNEKGEVCSYATGVLVKGIRKQ
ncbi:MAG: PaaI family thioesterase [Cyclobacteriaceae bacterium]|nr:PaaI family thioesterase [Cyclobacteriaceae bacterium]